MQYRQRCHAALLLLFCAVSTLVVFPSFATSLTLRKDAYVRGPSVRLGDVALIRGDDAEELATIDLGAAALPGQSRHLNASVITARIQSAGVDVSSIEVNGAERIRATTLHQELTPQMLADGLTRFIEEEMPWDPDRTEIDVPLPRETVIVPEGDLEIRWRPTRRYDYLGKGIFKGTIHVNGRVEKSILMHVEVESYDDVLVAARDIPRGHPVSPNDVELKRLPLSGVNVSALHTADQAVGLIAKKTLFAGQVLSERNVAPPILVKRNQVVPVELRSGGLKISTQARVLTDGRAGDMVLCAGLGSKEQFQGVVRADGVVVVN